MRCHFDLSCLLPILITVSNSSKLVHTSILNHPSHSALYTLITHHSSSIIHHPLFIIHPFIHSSSPYPYNLFPQNIPLSTRCLFYLGSLEYHKNLQPRAVGLIYTRSGPHPALSSIFKIKDFAKVAPRPIDSSVSLQSAYSFRKLGHPLQISIRNPIMRYYPLFFAARHSVFFSVRTSKL